jgi:mannan endo-1,4-beta-mannosidase
MRRLILAFQLGATFLFAPTAYAADLALNQPASASSTEGVRNDLRPALANDGNSNTRWASDFSVPQWWQVDLGSIKTINRVELNWEVAYASRYAIQTRTTSMGTWSTAAVITNNSAGQKIHTFAARDARQVRIYAKRKGSPWGVSLWDARVCNDNNCSMTPPPPPPPPPSTGSGVYQASGRHLLDPCGERLVVRGVEQMFWQTSWLSPWFVPEIAKTGANTVRILPQISAPTPTGEPPLSLATMEVLIQLGIQNHMLVDVAVNGGKDPSIYLRSDVKALLLKYEKNIVIHAKGEGYERTGAEWATNAKNVVSQLRSAGYKAPLYIMATNGGRNLPVILNYGTEILAADPLRNIVFGWQAYWGSSNYYQNLFGMTLAQAMAKVRDAPFPIQVGLLHVTDGTSEAMNHSTVMADAQAYGIGWLWWDWRMDRNNLTTDGISGHWATYGQDVALTNPTSISRTAVRTYFQQNGACSDGV